MKKRSKLKLHRETLAALDPKHLQAAGANCTCSCCPTDCCAPSGEYSCLNTCECTTYNNEFSCICA
ncbi:MAG TPA: hypothetical protein VKK31_06915 [Thermoanaerobaculia bacterium]|jgi:hypothetical protein|nr:hypothetical protein [Thermoanaerobaculia bacterium]